MGLCLYIVYIFVDRHRAGFPGYKTGSRNYLKQFSFFFLDIIGGRVICFSSHRVFGEIFIQKFKLLSWTQLHQNSPHSVAANCSPAAGARTPVNSCPSPATENQNLRRFCRKLNPELPMGSNVRFSAGFSAGQNHLSRAAAPVPETGSFEAATSEAGSVPIEQADDQQEPDSPPIQPQGKEQVT